MKEEIAVFGDGEVLTGITTEPEAAPGQPPPPAVIILNAGIIHRVGPNRIHVNLARQLAAIGFLVLRFDFSGVGDSEASTGGQPSIIERVISETQEAMDYLGRERGTDRVILMGICSGAIISFKTACADPRVVGAVLINASGHLHGPDEKLAEQLRDRAMARHYWRIATTSSFRGKNWLKALTGKVDYKVPWRVLTGLLRRRPSGQEAALEAVLDTSGLEFLVRRGVRLFIIHSEADEGLDYLHLVLGERMAEWRESGPIRLEIIKGANHVFTLRWSQHYLMDVIREWAQEFVTGLPSITPTTR